VEFLFVGERPSRTAYEKGWTWESGRLAGKTLAEALAACGVDIERCSFVNLFGDDPDAREGLTSLAAERARRAASDGRAIVALGNKVSRVLTALEVPHRKMVHPAARGRIRAAPVYLAHVRAVLTEGRA
jgi:uracil-DNA glycosylase